MDVDSHISRIERRANIRSVARDVHPLHNEIQSLAATNYLGDTELVDGPCENVD